MTLELKIKKFGLCHGSATSKTSTIRGIEGLEGEGDASLRCTWVLSKSLDIVISTGLVQSFYRVSMFAGENFKIHTCLFHELRQLDYLGGVTFLYVTFRVRRHQQGPRGARPATNWLFVWCGRCLVACHGYGSAAGASKLSYSRLVW